MPRAPLLLIMPGRPRSMLDVIENFRGEAIVSRLFLLTLAFTLIVIFGLLSSYHLLG